MKRILFISSLLVSGITHNALAADVASGESIFNKKCGTCHEVGADAQNSAGPLLNNIVGAQVGAVDGFKYSKSLRALGENGIVWSEEELDKWLINQKKYVRATLDDKKAKSKMNVKVKKPDERADLIAYLSTLTE